MSKVSYFNEFVNHIMKTYGISENEAKEKIIDCLTDSDRAEYEEIMSVYYDLASFISTIFREKYMLKDKEHDVWFDAVEVGNDIWLEGHLLINLPEFFELRLLKVRFFKRIIENYKFVDGEDNFEERFNEEIERILEIAFKYYMYTYLLYKAGITFIMIGVIQEEMEKIEKKLKSAKLVKKQN